MKTHEETWTRVLWMHDHNQEPIYGIESDAIPKKVDDHFCEFSAGEYARSQLAAAAPEMARELLRREWFSSEQGDYCPSCQCDRPRNPAGAHLAPYYDPRPGVGHVPECEWLVMMQKAGVLGSGHT
jgi:hypothetical protein